MLSYASPLGLYAEEIDPATGATGNFQAFTHLALINAVMHVIRADQGLETAASRWSASHRLPAEPDLAFTSRGRRRGYRADRLVRLLVGRLADDRGRPLEPRKGLGERIGAKRSSPEVGLRCDSRKSMSEKWM